MASAESRCSAGRVTAPLRDLLRWLVSPLAELTVGLWLGIGTAGLAGWRLAGPWGAVCAAAVGLVVGSAAVALALARHFPESPATRRPELGAPVGYLDRRT